MKRRNLCKRRRAEILEEKKKMNADSQFVNPLTQIHSCGQLPQPHRATHREVEETIQNDA